MYFQAIVLVNINSFKQFRNYVESFYHTDNKPQILRLIIRINTRQISESKEIPISRLFPRRPWKLVQTLLKVKRSGGYAVSGRIFLFQSVFRPKTFSLSRLYNECQRQRKQATDGKVRK